jgi:hypothetical protein
MKRSRLFLRVLAYISLVCAAEEHMVRVLLKCSFA